MNLAMQIIRRVELPKLTGRAGQVFIKYPTQIIALLLSLTLVYVFYFIIIMKNYAEVPFNVTLAYKNITHAAGVLASFFVIFSRNKLKNHSQLFFFLNSHIRAYEIVISSYALIYVTYIIIMTLFFSPLLILFWQQGKIHSILDIVVLFYVLTFVFWLGCTTWIMTNVFIKNLFSKQKEHFYLTATLHCAFSGGIIFLLIHFFEQYLAYNLLTYLIIISFLFFVISWVLMRASTVYINNIFIYLNSNDSYNKIQSLHFQHKSNNYLNMKLEWLNFTRNKIYKEQSLIFLILLLVCLILSYTVSCVFFTIFNSYLINFGLKEIFILLSLEIGISYRQYRNVNYSLNFKQSCYFLPRVGMVLFINLVAYITYVGVNCILIDPSQIDFISISALCSILFVTMLAMAIGFSVNINDSNKAIIVILTIILVNVYDLLMFNMLKFFIYVDLLNGFISILLYLYIITIYVRKPYFK